MGCGQPNLFFFSQALIVSYEESLDVGFSLKTYNDELEKLLPAEVLSDSDATKELVIERMTSGSAPLVHILAHGTAEGRDDRHLPYKTGQRRGGRKQLHQPLSIIYIYIQPNHPYIGRVVLIAWIWKIKSKLPLLRFV